MLKTSLFIGVTCVLAILGWYTYAIQDTIADSSIDDIIIPCNQWFSWYHDSPLIITEIWFDGTDERVEITNIAPTDIVDTLILSWAKSKPITLTWISIPTNSSIILADSASSITWDVYKILWLWLSIPDTTGFTISITNPDNTINDIVSFPAETINAIPNDYSISKIAVFDIDSGILSLTMQRYQTDVNHIVNTALPLTANPWIFYCQYPNLVQYNTWNENIDLENTHIIPLPIDVENTWNDTSTFSWQQDPNIATDLPQDDQSTWLSESWENLPIDLWDGENMQNITTTWINNTSNITWQPNPITVNNNPASNNDNNTLTSGNQTQNTTVQTSGCYISEIHSVVDILPEYIEIYCSQTTSGTLLITWLWTSTTQKSIPIHLQTWGYMIVTSVLSWFSEATTIYTLAGISLRDDGEDLISTWPNQTTNTITYPAIEKWQSYYPRCVSGYLMQSSSLLDTDPITCINPMLPTPWYDSLYNDLYQPYFPTKTIYQTSSTSSPTTSSTTYYQDLYKKRKETATTQEKTIAELKKSISKLNTWSTSSSTKSSSTKPATKTTTKTIVAKSTSTKASTSTKSTTAKKTTTTKASSTTKASASKTTTPKTKTVSTTSKAYLLLNNEHKLYKAYIDFIHTYLKSHLYTQYDTLKISSIQWLLKKSLQTAKQNRTILTYSWWDEISIFDISSQWRKIWSPEEKSLDQFVYRWYDIFLKLVQSTKSLQWVPFLATYLNHYTWNLLPVDI